jgi:hypothetical protein
MSLVQLCHYCFPWSKILGDKSHPSWLDPHPKTLHFMPLRVGGGIKAPGKQIQVQWRLILCKVKQSVHSDCCPSKQLTVLLCTFTWDSSVQMEWDLCFSPTGYPFHPGIPKTQIFPNHVYIDATGVPRGVSDKFKTKKSNSSKIWISIMLVVH